MNDQQTLSNDKKGEWNEYKIIIDDVQPSSSRKTISSTVDGCKKSCWCKKKGSW